MELEQGIIPSLAVISCFHAGQTNEIRLRKPL